ncbi:MAG: HDOD domain-containing protein [candidate division Zixibacteria bacterium]|nr:HDOD domain-containing protein [candidate division Zixibacteria bacterium]
MMEAQKIDINGIKELPSLPIIVQKLQMLVTDSDASSQEVAKIAEADPPFVIRLLRVVNSPFYGFRRKIASVEEAITMLGFNAVHQLVLTTSLMTTIGTDQKAVNIGDFWRHSFAVGVIAKHLLPRADRNTRSEVLICGILHDIGRIVMARNESEAFMAFYGQQRSISDMEEEARVFGYDHQQLGEIVALKWNLPKSVIATIANHHTPQNAPEKLRYLVSAVNIGDMLCHALQIGDSGNFYIAEFSTDAWQTLNLNMEELEVALRRALKEIDQAKDMFMDFG